jgi:undecaprenyl pyrophosphate synthase
VAYVNKVRSMCKDLFEENEYANAQRLYSRCLGDFKNIPKKIKDALSPEENLDRDNIMFILLINLAQCALKR